MKLLEKIFVYSCFLIIILGSIFYYIVDVNYVNPIIVYTQGVDHLNLKLTKKEYRRGEMVQFYTSFCKLRFAQGQVEWTDLDGRPTYFPTGALTQVSTGCYPLKQDKLIPRDIANVPMDSDINCDHRFSGVATRYLPDGRKYNENLGTETYCVIN